MVCECDWTGKMILKGIKDHGRMKFKSFVKAKLIVLSTPTPGVH